MYVVLSDPEQRRKISVGNRLDPDPLADRPLPDQPTAASGHCGYGAGRADPRHEAHAPTSRNDYSDALALKAAELVFRYLPRLHAQGSRQRSPREDGERATLAIGLWHLCGDGPRPATALAATSWLKIPHGRAVALFLPYVMEYTANAGGSRFGEVARHLRLTSSDDEQTGAHLLIDATRALEERLGQPTSIAGLGISPAALEDALKTLCAHALSDSAILAAPRMPAGDELERLFLYAMEGKSVDF